ncbi:DUF4267 domain-containing protein [Streptomyces sp. NPDC086989]|uniref:DUF4267 domain-containing protein n=1 Tax=Streptomyces sp. NPDC086989 TaxID=3365764 RepID=UPI00382DD2A8
MVGASGWWAGRRPHRPRARDRRPPPPLPQAAAVSYGVAARQEGDPAYPSVKGAARLHLRSDRPGLALLVFADADADGLAWYMLAVAVTPFGDTWILLRHGGTRPATFGIHFVPAVPVVLSATLLFVTAS